MKLPKKPTPIKILDFNVEWSLDRPDTLSFVANLSRGYIMEGHDLKGKITIRKKEIEKRVKELEK